MSIGLAPAIQTRRARRRGGAVAALVVAAFLVYAATGGGRIVGSDEVTMFELSRAMLGGRIAVPEGATLLGPDGRFYTKNAAGQAIAALPLVAVSEAAAGAAHLEEPRRTLAVRFGASFFNALVTALLLGLFFSTARRLGAGPGAATAATLMLGLTTPLWPYSKSFMAEPLQALGLLLALAGATRAAAGEGRAARLAALGVLIAVSAKLSMLPLALACLLPLVMRPRAWGWPLLGLLLALAGHAAYDVARFGTPFETGYGAQATASAYTTPLWVGLYGLLISSGKGVLWFAPALLLVPAGWRAARARDGDGSQGAARRATWGIGATWLVALPLYGCFQHWAGDGSFGPRYLMPLLPPAFLLVALGLERGGRVLRGAAWGLALIGLLVQIGGVSIYFGAQMREAGDYPYTLPLAHPRFMSDSHFNPAFTPIAGHWRMLLRNAGEHLRGDWPRLSGEDAGDHRLEVGAADQARLLHALDFWWLYLIYGGLPARPVLAVAAALSLLALLAGVRAIRRGLADEPRPGAAA